MPAALFFFGRRDVVPAGHLSGAMKPFPFLAGTAGALVGGPAEYRLRRAGLAVGDDAANRLRGSLGLLMMLMGLLILAVLAAAGLALYPPSAAGISAAGRSPDGG